MTLADSIAASFHKPRATCRIGGRRFHPISVSVSIGFETGASQAQIELSSEEADLIGPDTTLDFRSSVEIDMGYDEEEVPVFRGYTEDDGLAYWPQGNRVVAIGPLKKAQYEAPTEATYASQLDTAIVSDLLADAGIDSMSIEGPDPTLTLGTVEDVILKAGSAPFDLIKRIDEVAGFITFDGPDGIVRRRRNSGLPSGSPAWTYVQGENILDIDPPRLTSEMRNKVVVTGLPQGDFTPSATQQAANSYIPNPPEYVADNYSNDLIETDDIAGAVAVRRLKRKNRIIREITLQVPGNPLIYPGMTIGIQAPKVKLYTVQPYLVKHVSHSYRAGEFTTRITVEGGDAAEGYPVIDRPDGGVAPEPVIEMVVTAEAWEITGVVTRVYTVSCSGSGSYHPNREPGHIDYAWSNNKNGDTSATDRYSTFFTVAELATAEITLEVTDSDNSDLSKSITIAVQTDTTEIIQRALHMALDDIAMDSTDGGLVTEEYEAPFPGATTRRYNMAAEMAHSGLGWYGAIGSSSFGEVAHWLVAIQAGDDTEPDVPVHNFGSATGKEITAIWVHEQSGDRIVVGLANGEIWATSNATALQSSLWQLLVTLPDRVEWLIESFGGWGEIRACAGDAIYITFDEFSNYTTLLEADTPGDIFYRQALSPFGNYASGDMGVVTESGDPITFAAPPSLPILGLTHHIRRDILFAGDSAGQTYRKEEGETEFVAVGALASGAAIRHMIRDGDNPGALYLAAEDGIYKSPNEGENWFKIVSWDEMAFTDREGWRVGYSNAPVPAPGGGEGGCISDFYIQEEYTGPGAGGESTHRQRVSRVGSGGTWKDEHAFANDGTWTIELVSLSDTPALYVGWVVRTVIGVSGQDRGQLVNAGDTVLLDNTGGPAFDFFYLFLDDFDERLPQHATFKVCRTDAGAGTDIVNDSGPDADAYLVSGSSIPPGWYLPGFTQDGSWQPATDLMEPDDTHTGAPLIWAGTPSGGAEQALFRHEITPALDAINSAVLLIRANNRVEAIYMNGELVGSVPASGASSGDSDPFEIVIDTSLIDPLGTNLLAMHVVSSPVGGGDTTAWVSYSLELNGE